MTLPIPWAPLYPSQISGAPSLETVRWRGDWRDFNVQWHEDRIYFQLVEGEPTVWASLESCAPDEAVACFEDAVLARRYGACFVTHTKVHWGYEHFLFLLHFTYAPDGTGFLREWCSRDWIAFAPPQTRFWALLPDLHLPAVGAPESRECCQFAAKSVREQILFRRIPDEEIARLRWRSHTTQTEFERVMRWTWNAGFLRPEIDPKRNSNFWKAGLHTGFRRSVTDSAPCLDSNLFLSHLRWSANPAGWEWLCNYFSGEGLQWHATEWGQRKFRRLRAREPHLRAFFEPRSISWNVSFGKRDEPSFHQQLEAQLQLRTWLLQRATPAQVETFLRAD